jgi:quercetin dioxygenase-like cupin family protein
MMPQTSDETVRYYSSAELQLREDVPGAFVWAVCLERTMLTYFDVQPHSRFYRHQHESEQITLVLEGELFFETAGQVIAVKAGDVIALPSNVPHAVFTREQRVRAVDAWSPVREQYRR